MRTSNRIVITFGFVFVLISGFLLVELVFAEEGVIPFWIKNTAKFWADDQISNQEFLTALQFLIDNGILKTGSQNEENVSNLENIVELKSENKLLRIENNDLRNQNSKLQSELKTNQQYSNLDVIVDKKPTTPMSEYCRALKEWNEQYNGAEWLTAETKKEFNRLCVSTSPTTGTKIINEDKTLGTAWDSTYAKFLPRPENLVGTWQLGEKKSYIEDPEERQGSTIVNSGLESFTGVSYTYHTSNHKVQVGIQDFDLISANEVLEAKKNWRIENAGGRIILSDELKGNCFAHHRETNQHNVYVYCSEQNSLGFVVNIFGPNFDSTKKYAFQIANIVLSRIG